MHHSYKHLPARCSRIALAIVAIALLIPVADATAAKVTNTNDSGPGSLRQAIVSASPGETISVPAGTYKLKSEHLEIDKSLKIVGDGAATTTISGGNALQIFSIVDPEETAVVEIAGLTLREGRVTGFREGEVINGFMGAAIEAQAKLLILRRDVLTANVADSATGKGKAEATIQGGTLSFAGKGMTIADTQITGNTARAAGSDGRGAGLIEGGAVLDSASELTIERSTIANNIADVRGGPGQNGGEIYGAGILAAPAGLPEELEGTMVISDSTISGNSALAAGGSGGLGGYAQGGGIFVLPGGTVHNSLTRDTITANTIQSGPNGTAQGAGVAMVSVLATDRLAISRSTIAGNSAIGFPGSGNGGNVFAGGFWNVLRTTQFNGESEVSLANTIVSKGVGGTGTENCMVEKFQPALISLGFNLDSRNQCGFNAGGDIVGKDPLLGPLQSNGGPTSTLLPAKNSPAVDQGSGSGTELDQRGLARPFDFATIPNSTAGGANGSDIGAVELQANGG